MFKKRNWQYKLIAKSKEFDKKWYLKTYRDVAQAKMDPVEHYIKYGWYEGRNPGPNFNTCAYLGCNPDVAKSGMCPLLHWERFGRKEVRTWWNRLSSVGVQSASVNSSCLNNHVCGPECLKKHDPWQDFFNKKLEQQIAKHHIISFDIFDTLLIRPYVNPTDLFYHIENLFEIDGFAEARIATEHFVRTVTSKKDVSLTEIYDAMLPKYQKYKTVELKMEKAVLRAHPLMYKYYKKAVEQGKKIIIVSDMYLPSEFLKTVLRKNGYDVFDKLYVSCECDATKADGSIYEKILSELSIDPGEILHIGDNNHSDVLMANKYGVGTYFVPKYMDVFLNDVANRKYRCFYEQKPDFMRSYLIAMIAQNQMNKKMSYWQSVGYNFSGPLCLGYSQLIDEESKLNDIDSLLFVSRDGYLLRKVYNKISKKPIDNYYIYAPRILNLRLYGDFDNLEHYMTDYINLLRTEFPNIKFANDYKNNLEILYKNREEIMEWHKRNRAEYASYLRMLNVKGMNIAAVDMTTGAYTSQKILMKVFKDRFKFSFFSACFSNKLAYKHVSYLKSVINPGLQLNIIELTELLATAPEFPVKDIRNGKPVYDKTNKYDLHRVRIVREIEKGCMQFVDDFCSLALNTNKCMPFGISLEMVFDLLDAYCRYLSCADKHYLDAVYHCADINNTEFKSLLDKISKQYGHQ